jgi:hypothetical protein
MWQKRTAPLARFEIALKKRRGSEFSMSGGAGSTIGEKVRSVSQDDEDYQEGSESLGDRKRASSAIGAESQVVGRIKRRLGIQ